MRGFGPAILKEETVEYKKSVLVSKGSAEALINEEDLADWEKNGFKLVDAGTETTPEAKSTTATKKKAAPKAPAKSRTRKRNVES